MEGQNGGTRRVCNGRCVGGGVRLGDWDGSSGGDVHRLLGRLRQAIGRTDERGKVRLSPKGIRPAKSSALTSLTSQVASLQSQNQSLSGQVTNLSTTVTQLNTTDTQLSTKVNSLESLLAGVSRNGHTLQFSGLNLQIVSGSGSTNGAVNGLGNLIIGYNENPGTQTGSHNLVLGSGQSFTSYGGIVGGQNNALSGPFADVFGDHNSATANSASVSGGEFNLASDPFSSSAAAATE